MEGTADNALAGIRAVMGKGTHLGEFEILVLAALMRLADQAYGVAIRKEIESRTERNASVGAVYATLERLEIKGLVRSQKGSASPERGGRAKRFFTIEPEGRQRLEQALKTLHQMTEGLVSWQ
jgi:PadR family transcriptional regulator PadR